MTEPLPRRIAWFAPWTWKAWKRWAVFTTAVFIVIYPFTLGPALWLTNAGYTNPVLVAGIYRPLLYLHSNFDHPFYDDVNRYGWSWGKGAWLDVNMIEAAWTDPSLNNFEDQLH